MASLYDVTIPLVVNSLLSLQSILKVAETHCSKDSTNTLETLLEDRIHADMLPLRSQISITVGACKKAVERLTGTAPPEAMTKDKPFAELVAVVADTLKEVQAVKAEQLVTPTTVVPCRYGPKTFEAPALVYFQGYALPTIIFHVVTAYDILRMKGVPVGKSDFIMSYMGAFKDVTAA